MSQSTYNDWNAEEFFNTLLEMLRFFRKKGLRKEIRDTQLDEADNKQIYNLYLELWAENTNQGYDIIYKKCRSTIKDILDRYHYQPVIPNRKRSNAGMAHLPVYIKVLIYYMTYRAIELYEQMDNKKGVIKPTQKGILRFIANLTTVNGKEIAQGYQFSEKTFTNFGISPRVFYEIHNYKQIELPNSYPGAKKRYLGYCLNYLTAYAGTVDNFLDLFGGSAFATAAILQQDTIDYFINEYDFFLINYYRVMAEKHLYHKFIRELTTDVNELQKRNYDVSFGQELFETGKQAQKEFEQNYPMGQPDSLNSRGMVQDSQNMEKWRKDTDDKKVEVAEAYTYLYSFLTTGAKSSKGAIKTSNLKKFCSFSKEGYHQFHKKLKRLKRIYNSDELNTQTEFLIEYFTNKAPDKYKLVEKLVKDIREDIIPIDVAMQSVEDNKKAQELLRLLGCTSKKKPRPFRTLFYSDSPYLNTGGYKAGNIDAPTMRRLIRRLADASREGSHFIFSCRGTKSIEGGKYSEISDVMRRMEDREAFPKKEGDILLDCTQIYEDCISRRSNDIYDISRIYRDAKKAMKKALNLLKENQSIYENLFQVFSECSKENDTTYYVLVCILKKPIRKVNEDLIKNNDKDAMVQMMLERLFVTEVFITDFDFVLPPDYNDYGSGKKGKPRYEYTFAKYKIDEFCQLLEQYLFKSKLYLNTKVIKKGDGYIFK